MAEKDKKGSYGAEHSPHQQQSQQESPSQTQQYEPGQPQHSSAPPANASTQKAAEMMLSILQQIQRQLSANSVVGTTSTLTPAQIERDAAFAGAAFEIINHGLALTPATTVTSVYPPEGPRSGGTGVTIRGTNFLPTAKVLFGSNAATNVNVISTTR